MKSGRKSAGRQLQATTFPELDKVSATQPVEEHRPARRMFGFHKNMHSPGFSLGNNQVAQRYMEKAIEELRKKQRGVSQCVESQGSNSSIKDQLEGEEVARLKLELRKKEDELKKLKYASVPVERPQPRLRAVPPSDLSSSLPRDSPLPSSHVRDHGVREFLRPKVQSPEERVKSESPFPSRQSPIVRTRFSPVIGSISKAQPTARNDTRLVHELASLPIFKDERFTHHHPKVHLDNPITGELHTGLSTLSAKDDSQSPIRKRTLAGYGSLLVGQ